jgi:hypothetical protein
MNGREKSGSVDVRHTATSSDSERLLSQSQEGIDLILAYPVFFVLKC